jgi:hypothetical protein
VGGGDGFYNVIDPSRPRHRLHGEPGRQRVALRRAHERAAQHPPELPEGERFRFNWNSPIVVSRYDSDTVYYGGNRFFASRDRGESWPW